MAGLVGAYSLVGLVANDRGHRALRLVPIFQVARHVRIPIESSTSYRGRNSRPNWLILAAFIGAALTAGALGTGFSPRMSAAANDWYAMLAKPAWAPPRNWFGPVWITLYVLMGTSAWLIWRERYHLGRRSALVAYASQPLLDTLRRPLIFASGAL